MVTLNKQNVGHLMHIRTKDYNQKIINSKTHLHELKIANIRVEVF